MASRSRPRQLDLDLRRWGGRRPGAGRKPSAIRRRVAHRARPHVTRHTPVMVSMRLVEGIPSLRDRRVFEAVWNAMQQGRERLGGRLVHFSGQSNHLHTIIETVDENALARFVAGLKIRIARAINRLLGREGRVFSDRYHSKVLRTPRETRNAIAYVLNNDLRHRARRAGAFDLFSSAPLFDGWAEGRVAWPKPIVGPPLCVAARAWLLTDGWRRAGQISLMEIPGPFRT